MVLQRSIRPGRARAVAFAGFAALALLSFALGARRATGARPPGDGADDATPPRYDRDVRPLLSDRCFRCHGQDESKRRAKLRLDDPADAFADHEGSLPIVPGDPDASELVDRIGSDDSKHRMPPPSSNKKPFTPDEQKLLRRWIAAGAKYETHWSFVPPRRPPLPDLGASPHTSWCRNPIDRFVLATLEQGHVAPGPDADKETLLRRLFEDLTGLPPTPEEIDAFLADARPDAYERAVDRLFSEEPWRTRYAERMASPWLDAARYADTCGIHTDAGRQMWLWRDWVLRAFRDDMPFDRFLIEQLAGDLLPDATEEQRIASGFNRNHITTDEGGAIPAEYLVEYAVDRTATTGSVFLGLTLGCARCHDHKFDPITQADFYGLYAFFDSIEEPGLYSQLPDPNRAFEPALEVPTAGQKQEAERLRTELATTRDELDRSTPADDRLEADWIAGVVASSGITWAESRLLSASAASGATVTPQQDGSLLIGGENPARDDHDFVFATDAARLRVVRLEALEDPSLPQGRIGRAENGNAVLTGVELEAVSQKDPAQRVRVPFAWVRADHEQDNGDFRAVNLLETHDEPGWAVDAHRKPGGRVALLLAKEPFGFEGGTELHVRLQYHSQYARHALGRVRLAFGDFAENDEKALDLLPAAESGWYTVGPFPDSRGTAFEDAFGPEAETTLDLAKNFGGGNQAWRFDPDLKDGQLNYNLGSGVNASYVARRLFVPTARKVEVALGSDDGFRLYVNGKEVAARNVDRSLAADQDRATLELAAGVNLVVLKIVNTGGPGGFYWRETPRAGELAGDLFAALLPAAARPPDLAARLHSAWRSSFSPGYRERRDRIAAIEKRLAEIDAAAPRTMVMQELATPRPTFVLTRGQYDKADPNRPVERAIPVALGRLPDGAPKSRLGLAQWLVGPDDPLVARVAVNRWWEMLFGTGIVRTTEDFGMQGEWPSHPELLDWLAVELRENGWDVEHLLRLIVTSSTYRQSSRLRPEVAAHDPDDRLLSWFPRRRLSAEQIRDHALYVSGLLVERLGGPSVKPYQPDGLWSEVAMPASNTRTFVRGKGDELWRRSLYTYWKRACPPPALQTFDAPTREFCTIRRTPTNTPLQALVLWNDEQFVEAARVLAQRTLAERAPDGGAAPDDAQRLTQMYRRCTGRCPDAAALALLTSRLTEFRRRYEAAPTDAEKLVKVGMAPVSGDVALPELAAWTMIASAMLNLDASVCRS
jgi:uncharacterized protein DUF1553/uncharacterized protein DUF1549/cytochrome c